MLTRRLEIMIRRKRKNIKKMKRRKKTEVDEEKERCLKNNVSEETNEKTKSNKI